MRLLVIEDDAVLGSALAEHLMRAGHAVDWFKTSEEAELAIATIEYDLVILDLSLPDGSGMDILRGLRLRSVRIPVIVATARDRIDDRIAGLDAGADDFVVKPYDLNELMARINAVARRSVSLSTADYQRGDVQINLSARNALRGTTPVKLTAREWMLLELLIARAGKLVSKSDLENRMYQFGAEIDSNTIEVFISRIRKKLGKDLIHTERGLGYRLEAS